MSCLVLACGCRPEKITVAAFLGLLFVVFVLHTVVDQKQSLQQHSLGCSWMMAEPSFTLLSQDVELLSSVPDGGVSASDNDEAAPTAEERAAILVEMEQTNGSSDEEMEDWLPLDEDLLSAAMNGGVERSRSVNAWARRRFDEWRKAFNCDTSIPIERIPHRELNEMLAKFIIQVKKKKDKKLYPPSTLSALYRAYGRILRRDQEKRIGQTGIREPPFDILTDPVFAHSKEAFIGMIKKTRVSGNYDRPKKKAPAISFGVESEILADIDHQITHPMGCIKRLVYFMLMRFGIRGVRELHSVKDCDVVLEKDDGGELVKYGERISKNCNPTATKFDDHHFRQPIWTYERDFVLTFKQYVRHLPAKEKDSEPRPFFLQPISKPRGMAWYSVTPVGVNNLGKWLNTMASVVSPETSICNKSGRVSLISRLAAADTPAVDGMRITGHKSTSSYEKYDRTRESKIKACMDIISQPDCRDFSKVLSDQIARDEESRKCLGEISGNIASKALRVSDFSDSKASSNMNDKENGAVISPVVVPSAVVPPVLVSPAIVSPVVIPPVLVPTAARAGNDSPSNDSEVFDHQQLVKKQSEVVIQKEEDDYDEDFYSELSKTYPDSARAIGKYIAPTISNQGSFSNCTFNFGVDGAALFGVIVSALKRGSGSS